MKKILDEINSNPFLCMILFMVIAVGGVLICAYFKILGYGH